MVETTEAIGAMEVGFLNPEIDYYAIPRVSRSRLEVFRESPPEYYARFVAKTKEDEEKSKALIFGQDVHCALFEPEKFQANYIVAPERWKQNTNAGKAALAEFQAKHPGKSVLWPEDWESIAGVVDCIEDNPLAHELLVENVEPEMREVGVYHTCPITGIRCKAKFDVIHKSHPRTGKFTVVDMKTWADIKEGDLLAWYVDNFGYHRQDAFYSQAARAAFGLGRTDAVDFVFVFVTKNSPYESVVVRIDDDFRSVGHAQIIESMTNLAHCIDNKTWHSKYRNQEVVVKAPRKMV